MINRLGQLKVSLAFASIVTGIGTKPDGNWASGLGSRDERAMRIAGVPLSLRETLP